MAILMRRTLKPHDRTDLEQLETNGAARSCGEVVNRRPSLALTSLAYTAADQDGFSGHWDARALDNYDEKDRAIPVMHKMLDESAIEEIHA